MKKIIMLSILCTVTLSAFSQNIFNKKENITNNKVKSGVVYSEHPALDAINSINKAFVSGDLEAYASFFSKDCKFYSVGDTASHNLERDLEIVSWWNENFTIEIERKYPANADVIKYTGSKEGVWVMDWIWLTAVNKVSGDTVKTLFHDEYFVNSENKVSLWFTYYDKESLDAQIQNSFGVHRNGRVFDEHPFIEDIKSLVSAYESGDVDGLVSYFSNDAKFYRLGGGDFDPYSEISIDDRIKIWKKEITANPKRIMEVYGYPDAIRYEKGDGGWEVLSWWHHIGTDKNGDKSRTFIHLSHSFNNEGKIFREVLWVE